MADLRMPDINNVIIVGNLIKDPVFRQTTTGTPVTNFYIASNRKFKDNLGNWKEDVCFIGVVAWYKLAESCNENLIKGSAVLVEGELQSRNWKTEDGYNRNMVEIKARRIQFLNKREYNTTDFYNNNYRQSDDEQDNSDVDSNVSKEEAEGSKSDHSSDDSLKEDRSSYDFGYKDLKL
ncbi:single-stranded DNA-binding protein [bacterium]|nr:single-stranded DNA-binding protein [bacterium]